MGHMANSGGSMKEFWEAHRERERLIETNGRTTEPAAKSTPKSSKK